MFDLILNQFFWIKIIILFIAVAYSVFSAVVFNQVRTMNEIIQLPPTKIVLSIAIINILLGALLFLIAIVIL